MVWNLILRGGINHFGSSTFPGTWLNMVNVKPPYLVDLKGESMKKFIFLSTKHILKCPHPLLRSMQQFVLEEHPDIMCSESDEMFCQQVEA